MEQQQLSLQPLPDPHNNNYYSGNHYLTHGAATLQPLPDPWSNNSYHCNHYLTHTTTTTTAATTT
eukprot:gene6881-9535_t